MPEETEVKACTAELLKLKNSAIMHRAHELGVAQKSIDEFADGDLTKEQFVNIVAAKAGGRNDPRSVAEQGALPRHAVRPVPCRATRAVPKTQVAMKKLPSQGLHGRLDSTSTQQMTPRYGR